MPQLRIILQPILISMLMEYFGDFENKKPKSFSNATSEVRALLSNTRRSARTSAENGTNASQKVFQSKIFVHADARRMISAINYCMNMRKQTA